MLQALVGAIKSALGDEQTGEQRTRYAMFLPQYRDLRGNLVDNEKAWWVVEKGQRKLAGGQEIFSGGPGEDCMIFHVGQLEVIPPGRAGDFFLNYLKRTPEKRCQFLLLDTPSPVAIAEDLNAAVGFVKLDENQTRELLAGETGNFAAWKDRVKTVEKITGKPKKGAKAA